MALTAEEKQEIIKTYATHEGDTGSPEVGLLCSPSASLMIKDRAPRRGLLLMVGDRRRMLDYLKRVDINRYSRSSVWVCADNILPPERHGAFLRQPSSRNRRFESPRFGAHEV